MKRSRGARALACSPDTPAGVPGLAGGHAVRRDRAARTSACATSILILYLLTAPLFGQQQNVPHVGFVYPAGGRQGSTLEVTVGGQFLNNANTAFITGSGVDVSVMEFIRPLTPAQAQEAREQVQKLNQKRQSPGGLTPEEIKTLMGLQEKLQDVQRRNQFPALAEKVIVKVVIAPDAAPGRRELRLGAQQGLTNPLIFTVGNLPEFSRPFQHVPPAFAVANGATPPARPVNRPVSTAMDVTLPAVLNGQVMPATTDQYRFHAGKGQHLVAEVEARELMPYISDAVPGWFQAAITLRGSDGKEIASADHYRFHPDPVIEYDVPADGDYSLEIHDSIYRGREDFVYRITLGQLPYITDIFPLGGRTGAKTQIHLAGWNLPQSSLPADVKSKPGEVRAISVAGSNSLPFAWDTLPEVAAQDSANRREKAQRIKLPVIVNGRLAHAGDSQFFRFDGHAGQEIVAEVLARRLGSPLDSTLRLTDAAGKELAFNDDFEDKSVGLLTHQADSRILIKLPSDGSYYLQLADNERKGGVEYAYRLRISQPRPDYDLRVTPSSVNMRAGSTMPITVYAIRHDGFAGEIALALKDPSGFTLTGAAIPSGQDKVRITLTSPRGQPGKPFTLQLEGRATIAGKEVRHNAVPAEDMMQAFAYHHLVAEQAWMIRIIGAGQGAAALHAAGDSGVKLRAGATTAIQIVVPPRLMDGMVLTLDDPPEGISIQEVRPDANGMAILLRADAKAKAGLKGNLIVDAYVDRIVTQQNGPSRRNRNLLGTLPAIPFEVTQ
ncbi:MAG TPA: hypothetical protein VML19_14115 [Verrucomicrobiae bacterium]|nr:hypothetical protein [Verrucomicrobiae bacterium]